MKVTRGVLSLWSSALLLAATCAATVLAQAVESSSVAESTASATATDRAGDAATLATTTVLRARVLNVASDVGSLYVSVYDSKETFLGDEKVVFQLIPVAEHLESGRIVFELTLPYGEYAIAIHHDSNDNQKMDTNFIGIPKEPVALSNGHIARYGPPKYKKAKFLLAKPQHDMDFTL